MTRSDGRRPDELRTLTIEPDYLENPHGSALITQGKTKVLCTAMVQEEVPRWLRNKGRGWMTAEYSLLPASTGDRVEREAARGKQQGRTIEMQATAEKDPFTRETLDDLLALAEGGIAEIGEAQLEAVSVALP